MKIAIPIDLDHISEHALLEIGRFLDHLPSSSYSLLLLAISDLQFAKKVPDSLSHLLPGLDRFREGLKEHLVKELQTIQLNHFSRDSIQLALMEQRHSIGEDIADCCRENSIDMILISSQRKSRLSHFFLGSVTEETLRHASCPVLVFPPEIDQEEAPEIFRMVITCDLTEASAPAFETGKKLLELLGTQKAHLTVVHVCQNLIHATYGLTLGVDPDALQEEQEQVASIRLDALVQRYLPGQAVEQTIINSPGPAEEEFLEYLRGHNVDLVISAHGEPPDLEHRLFGGFTRAVLTKGKRKVLIVPRVTKNS